MGYQVRYSSRQCPPKRLKGQERGRRQVNHHRLDHEMDLHLVSIGWPLGDAFGEHRVPISGDVCYQPGLLCVCSAFTHPTAHSKPLFGPFFAHRLSPYLPTKYVFPSPHSKRQSKAASHFRVEILCPPNKMATIPVSLQLWSHFSFQNAPM